MEVMNRAELTQNDILVGQKSVTRSFGVSDDPMLMSMLSTGFYQRPLRTMIQEVMFNAWDAHRMGNCQHRPIDIYLNETTGLIIRDYGPGIDPGENDDNMHEIYCMYGGSTKRKMKNQTGGFGLGSKSPFAYTESFTVTSHFGGTKNMYLISRVSESNGGKPGMTSLVRVPTTETGLLVTVPLKKGDLLRAYEFVKDVLFLSGIKAMIHFEDEADEFVDSAHLEAGQYLIDDNHRQGRVYAVYGGVRYEIPKFDEYENEFEFMQLISKGYDLFIGFAPDTLSPLPNREGLNMGEKSKESVKTNFELCMERFDVLVEPMTRSLFKNCFTLMKKAELQGEFAFIEIAKYGCDINADNRRGQLKEMIMADIPADVEDNLWNIMLHLMIHNTGAVMRHIKVERWRTIFISEFIKIYPECKPLAYAVLKAEFNQAFPLHHKDQSQTFVSEFTRHKFLRNQANFVRRMKEAYPDDPSLHPVMRVIRDENWEPAIWDRGFANLQKTEYGTKKLKSGDPRLVRSAKGISLLNLYSKKQGEKLPFCMMDKTIIIGKTVTVLKEMNIPSTVQQHSSMMRGRHYYYDGISTAAPAYVIYDRKGAYAKAMEILSEMGFTVYEAEEPEKKVYIPKAKVVPTYSLIRPQNAETWCSNNPNDQIPDPTHFYYATQATLKGYSSGERPDRGLVYWFQKKNPKFVTLNHARSVEAVKKLGAIPFHEGLTSWYDAQSTDINRMMNIIRATRISQWSILPNEMIKHPLIQLELGMEPVDPMDTDFWYEAEGYNLLMSSEYFPLRDLKRKVTNDIEALWGQDPEAKNIRHMCDVTKVLNSSTISSLWSDTKTTGRSSFVDKVIATLKLFS